ncbi:MAG: hypothetical protein OXR66_02875 [Candidatus Woesearchaeota archaeon]|nr:hypothetical protein [Candidatus Woesearchaeota archaeon]
MSIKNLEKKGTVSKISPLEKERYIEFFTNAWQENFDHAKHTQKSFPRWSIISGYYAMHDRAKLFLATLNVQVDFNVHTTTVQALKAVAKDKELIALFEIGHKEFITFANDLAQGKNERVKAQYYTGTAYMQKEYQKQANEFLEETVKPFLERIEGL